MHGLLLLLLLLLVVCWTCRMRCSCSCRDWCQGAIKQIDQSGLRLLLLLLRVLMLP